MRGSVVPIQTVSTSGPSTALAASSSWWLG